MLVIRNDKHIVFFEEHEINKAKEFRSKHAEFKHKRIKRVIQLRPDLVVIGQLMER